MTLRRNTPKGNGLLNALDEAAFGAERTLNLRELLPTAAEARLRTEVWLRARQVTKPDEVLIITGRGNQSVGGVGVIREEVLAMLPSLRRRGIVESWREHSPGSLVVKLASTSALFMAAKRRRDAGGTVAPPTGSLVGLEPPTVAAIRQLALHMLDSLGIEHTEPFVEKEMSRIFSTLVAALPPDGDREQTLRAAVSSALKDASEAQ
ncbi:MAG: Smr/MutS family protein [Gemmatimonadaceae bacterium]